MKKNMWQLPFFIVFLILSGCTTDKPAELIQIRRVKPYHIVKAGEDISSIATKYKMKQSTLIVLNRLQAPYNLIQGQRLIVHVHQNNMDQTSNIAEEKVQEVSSSTSVVEEEVESKSLSESSLTTTDSEQGERFDSDNLDQGKTLNDKQNNAKNSSSSVYMWPVQGKIIQSFGDSLKSGGKSDGIIISAPMNTKIKAVCDGVLRSAGSKLAAYGKMVVIKHNDGKMTIYAHLNEIFLKEPLKGQVVNIKKGEVIGTVGKSGIATRPQLYFQVRGPAPNLTPINPLNMLP